MRIEVYFSDCYRELPFFEQLEDFVTEQINQIPGLLDVFCRCMEAHANVKEKTQESCESLCKQRRYKTVKKC